MADFISCTDAATFINDRVSYKPGYKIVAGVPVGMSLGHEMLQLTLVLKGVDSDTQEDERLLQITRLFPGPFKSLELLFDLLSYFVHEWEVHEADEWLKVDGQKVRDPHG